MAVGFVLISTAPAKEHIAYNRLQKVPGVTEVVPLFGEYDFIAKIEAETFDDLGKIVRDKIRTVEGVTDTKTLTGKKYK